MSITPKGNIDFDALTGICKGPYLSYNPVSRTQIWQWCSAMGDLNPLYLDKEYQASIGINTTTAIAPPAMMQMWTMRDVNLRYAPGSTDAAPYEVIDVLSVNGYPGNVAVSYDLHFYRLLQEGDRAHHFITIDSISELKTTALGQGFFFVEHTQFYDQNDALFAEAYITYFQYLPTSKRDGQSGEGQASQADTLPVELEQSKGWQTNFEDVRLSGLEIGTTLPELVIPITHKLIVAGAIASQDYTAVHHNAPAAKAAAMPDIFMNILTTCGLCSRYLTDWAGPNSRLTKLKLNLMAPNTPGDTMVLQGQVTELSQSGEAPSVTVEFAGKNTRGFHVTGSASLTLID